ncbi:MAG: sugar phosphate isomerase/epimerase [Planctomycetota bacterium]|nr:sugar phosphate isomerase/epimerase [Planctomycetota bacterium]
MKLAVSTYSLWRWRAENKKTIEDALNWIAESGTGAVEFCNLDDKPAANPIKRAGELRKRCEKLGLAVAGYAVGGELLSPPEAQAKAVEQLKREVDTAAALGAKSMRHDVSRGWGENAKGLKGAQTFANALKVIVPALRDITTYGQSQGVKTSIENHGFYMQASERIEKLIKAVKHPNYGLTMDMGNFLCVNEDPVKAVARVAKYAVMCHTKDFHVRPKDRVPPSGWFNTPTEIALRGAIVGHGEINIPKQLAILKKAGYKGFLSLEFEGMEEPGAAVKLGLEYLRLQLKAIDALD